MEAKYKVEKSGGKGRPSDHSCYTLMICLYEENQDQLMYLRLV